MTTALVQVVAEEEPAEWTTTDIERFKKDNMTVLSKQLEARIEGAHIGARAATQRVGSAAASASVSGSRVGTPQLQPQELHRRLQSLREPTLPSQLPQIPLYPTIPNLQTAPRTQFPTSYQFSQNRTH
jgi:hypothetical protein